MINTFTKIIRKLPVVVIFLPLLVAVSFHQTNHQSAHYDIETSSSTSDDSEQCSQEKSTENACGCGRCDRCIQSSKSNTKAKCCANNKKKECNVCKKNQSNQCTTPACVQASKTMRSYMNTSVDPCDDFYSFACGNFQKITKIPADRSFVSTFSVLQDKVNAELINELAKQPNPSDPRAFQIARTYQNTCTNKEKLNAQGIQPMIEVLSAYGGWPVALGNEWKADFDWVDVNKRAYRAGLDSYILMSYVDVDIKNSEKRVISVDSGYFGVDQGYLRNGMDDPIIKAYYQFMVEVAVIFGANKTYAENELRESLKFEITLAKNALYQSRDFSITYNPFTIKELQATYPFIDWLAYINWYLNGIVVNEDEKVIVVDKNYMQTLNSVIQSTPKRVIANYYAWQIICTYCNYLNDELREVLNKYYAATRGQAKPLPWSMQCMQVTTQQLLIATGALYVRKFFNEKYKSPATEMTRNIRNEFIENLETNVPWMDNKTKQYAIEKAKAMTFEVAYPNELLDNSKLDEYYDDLVLDTNSFLFCLMNVTVFSNNMASNQLRESVNKSDWRTHSRTLVVNANYNFAENAIQIDAAIIQPPEFTNDLPQYMVYSRLAWIIGHEISHGFDDQGSQFDAHGNAKDWWAPSTKKNFLERAQCFIKQYSNYRHPVLNNLTVDGVNTQGENIADNGGVRGSYHAYQLLVAKNGPEKSLPDLNYTTNQQFWISAAQQWCQVATLLYDQNYYTTNVHSPLRYRVIGPFSNSKAFANDFHCPVGSPMNPKNKCDIW